MTINIWGRGSVWEGCSNWVSTTSGKKRYYLGINSVSKEKLLQLIVRKVLGYEGCHVLKRAISLVFAHFLAFLIQVQRWESIHLQNYNTLYVLEFINVTHD